MELVTIAHDRITVELNPLDCLRLAQACYMGSPHETDKIVRQGRERLVHPQARVDIVTTTGARRDVRLGCTPA